MKRIGTSQKSPQWMKGLVILLVLGIVGQSFAAFAGGFKPRKGIGKGARRIGLATRGGCRVSSTSPKLTALVPVGNNGLTMASRPTFHWFMPQHSYQATEFRLVRVDEATKTQAVMYTTVLENSGKEEFQSLTLPEDANVAPLEEGQDYRWDITLVCDPDEPSGNLLAQGWVRYEAPNAKLAQALRSATPEQSYELFASNGYWYETVQHLQTRFQENPEDTQTKQTWQSLMTQEEVKLGHLSARCFKDGAEETPELQ